MAKIEKAFVGEFKQLLENFVEQKRNIGYKYDGAIHYNLCKFSEYTLNYKIENKALSKELVRAWTKKKKNESVETWTHRASILRQFALYLQNQGYDAFIPPKSFKVKRSEYIPYIFTHKEIARLFQAVDSIPPHPLSNKHESFPLIFRLLYCCGFRISEVLHLIISDAGLDEGVLFIRGSKFNKDRLVPLSASLADMVRKYHALFNRNSLSEDRFFRKKDGTLMSRDCVYKGYRKLLWQAGISHGGKGKGPRLHDLRHGFCVHTIQKLVNNEVDLNVALPILSAYVGHASPVATQRYVRLTAEVYPKLIEKVSKTCGYIFSEVS